MPSGGMPGEGLNSDHPPGPLLAPSHTGHDIGTVGGEPPPSVVHTVLNVCLIEGIEREIPGHGDVHLGRRAKLQAAGRGGGSCKHGRNLSGLRAYFGGVEIL